jgi:hypothetical protein
MFALRFCGVLCLLITAGILYLLVWGDEYTLAFVSIFISELTGISSAAVPIILIIVAGLFLGASILLLFWPQEAKEGD